MEHALSGRADIVISDNDNNAWMVIECKTIDTYENAWKTMRVEPKQLFAYAQMLPLAKYLMLYASDFLDNIIRKTRIIKVEDDLDYLKNLNNDDIMTYKKAKTQEQKFEAWKLTYKEANTTKGFFEPKVDLFRVGVDKLSVDDLDPVTEEDIQGKYHEFATILRKYNVSGRENAFDRLVNLFLCKIVDETQNGNDLQFYYKTPLYDTYYKLQDRLQHLYQLGMKEFLGEDVTYIDDKVIGDTFKFLIHDKNATKEKIELYFRQLKFYKSNDFSFIDVYNEKLFVLNSDILVKVVEMLQDIRLTTNTPNQFLGDMFEGFLDQGIKQSEGQFFTPLPIVRFIMNSLPIEEIIKFNGIPKVLDYACGAGHFLTEYGICINKYINDLNVVKDYYASTYGIEKEYRLSKIAKVSSFMYGQGDIKILCADALSENNGIGENSFSLIIANPPYSVKGFLETLTEKDRNNYILSKEVDKNLVTCNNIECFFVERAKQLLKENGIAAIILPITILTKKTPKIYVKTREIILKYFEIISIVELGSGAFGKTNTATCILFLKRRLDNPELACHYAYRVNDWFEDKHGDDDVYKDITLFEKYCSNIGVEYKKYNELVKTINNEEEFELIDYVKKYYKEYLLSTRYKNLIKKPQYNKKDNDERKTFIMDDFRKFFVEIEKDKLLYYILSSIKESTIKSSGDKISYKEQEVIVVRAPRTTIEEKEYLGYEWSSAKNNEGIKYIINNSNKNINKDDDLEDDDKRILKNILNLDNIETPLYDTDNQLNPQKINYYIYSNFNNISREIPEELDKYISSVPLTQLIDFEKVKFGKEIDISLSDRNVVESKYQKSKLRNYVNLKGGNSFSKNLQGNENSKDIPFLKVSDLKSVENMKYITKSNNYLSLKDSEEINASIFEKDTIIFPKVGKAIETNKKRILGMRCIIDNNLMAMKIKEDKVSELKAEYLYYLFETNIVLYKFASLANPPSIAADNVYDFDIPIPPITVQEEIIDACAIIDNMRKEYYEKINQLEEEKENLINSIYTEIDTKLKLSQLAIFNPKKDELKEYDDNIKVSFVDMSSVSEQGFIKKSILKPLHSVRSGYTYFKNDDILVAKITPCMENGKCAIASELNNGIGMGSTEFHVIRISTDNNLNKYIFHLINRDVIRNEAVKKMTGNNGQQRVPEDFYYDIMIPMPEDKSKIKEIVIKLENYHYEIIKLYNEIEQVPALKKEKVTQYLM